MLLFPSPPPMAGSISIQFGIKKYGWFHILINFRNYDAIQQKVHKVGKQNFRREAFKENEVKMMKMAFLRKIVGRDI